MIIDISERSKRTVKKETDSEEWIRLPIAATQDADLTLCDALVLAYIIDRVDTDKKAVSIKSIADKLKVSERQIKRCIKNLIDNKYIVAEKRSGQITLYSQCNVLPPKRQSQKKPQKPQNGLDLEKYKIFINNFEEDYK